jgi:hypothetical protein
MCDGFNVSSKTLKTMGPIPLAVVASFGLLALVAKPPVNRAVPVLSGVQFLSLTADTMAKYSIPDRRLPQRAKPVKTEPLAVVLRETDARLVGGLSFIGQFRSVWAAFLTAVVDAVFCLALGCIPSAAIQKELTHFAAIFVILIVLIMRYGFATAFNRPFHRRFALFYGLLSFAASFVALQKTDLGAFDFRIFLRTLIDIPSIMLDALVALVIGIIAISLSTPLLYELFAIQRLGNLHQLVRLFPFAHPFARSVLGWKKLLLSLVHWATPLLPVAVWVILHFMEADQAVLIGFFCIELIVNAFKLACVKLRVQTCYFNVLGPIAKFDQSRSVADGRTAQEEVERAVRMVPITGLALSVHPMLTIVCASAWFAALSIAGPLGAMARQAAAFFAMAADLAMAGAGIVRLFLAPTD